MRDLNYALLTTTLPLDAIEWRIQTQGSGAKGPWALVVPYADARYLMSVLDAACGPENWKDSYEEGPQGGVKCCLSIRTGGEWVTKEDVAENTQVEAIKGGVTDAFKRACVKWNVANIRSLYGVGECWADFTANGKFKTKIDGKYVKWNPPVLDLTGATAVQPHTPAPEPGTIVPTVEASKEQVNMIERLLESPVVTDDERTAIASRLIKDNSKERAAKILSWLTETIHARKLEAGDEEVDPVLAEAIKVFDLAPAN